jgi:hypothetical protein
MPRESDFSEDAVCVFAARGNEERGRLVCWDDRTARDPAGWTEVRREGQETIVAHVAGADREISLKDTSALASVFQEREVAYLDISGLAHHVWAPLLRLGLNQAKRLWVIYVEPFRYRPHLSPDSDTTYDLSSAFGEVSPLPGFANLTGPTDETRAIFVPFLGFEGMRARQIARNLDPMPPKVVPVVGLPGFRIEYPFAAVASSQEFLDQHRAHGNVRLARASCPFEAYNVLCEIQKDNPGCYLYIAPVGTRPHALGAVWFAIDHPRTTEVMYDHPQPAPQRSSGVGTTHIYCLKDDS